VNQDVAKFGGGNAILVWKYVDKDCNRMLLEAFKMKISKQPLRSTGVRCNDR
jgi:hypothetical protein